jgi:hypothetical protein
MARRKIDSMGLMIDTMCNGVGGLVLVAVLVILISLGTSPSSKEGQMKHKKLQNEVVALEIKQQVLVEDRTRLAGVIDGSDSSLIDLISENEMESLATHQAELSVEETQLLQAVEAATEEIREADFLDPGAFLEAEMAHLREKAARGDEVGVALSKKLDVLADVERAYQALLAEAAQEKEKRYQKIKAPSERKYTKYDSIFFRYGQCYLVSDEKWHDPPSCVEVLSKDEVSIRFQPSPGLGVAMNSSQMKAFLAASNRKGRCCILGFYPDSFNLYTPMKKILDEWGLPHGIAFYNINKPPAYTSAGGTEIMGLGQ